MSDKGFCEFFVCSVSICSACESVFEYFENVECWHKNPTSFSNGSYTSFVFFSSVVFIRDGGDIRIHRQEWNGVNLTTIDQEMSFAFCPHLFSAFPKIFVNLKRERKFKNNRKHDETFLQKCDAFDYYVLYCMYAIAI